MKVLRVFFLGLVYGLFMKYILDEIYTKNHLKRITNENALLRERIKSLEAKSLQRTESTTQHVQRAEPVPMPPPQLTPSPSHKDDLKPIKGIGPQLEKKLNDAGVNTFEQMSRLTTTELQNILGLSKRATQNADNLITQAKKFAQQKSKK